MTSQAREIVVGFDLDGVIVDHAKNKQTLAAKYGISLLPEEAHSEVLPTKLSRDCYLQFQDELYGDSEFAQSVSLMVGAHETLQEFVGKHVPLFLISRRKTPRNAITLLDRNGLWGNVFHEGNTFFVDAPDKKNAVARDHAVTHFFDDERRVLRAMPDVMLRFLFDRCRQFNDEKEFERVYDWQMVRNIILLDTERKDVVHN